MEVSRWPEALRLSRFRFSGLGFRGLGVWGFGFRVSGLRWVGESFQSTLGIISISAGYRTHTAVEVVLMVSCEIIGS